MGKVPIILHAPILHQLVAGLHSREGSGVLDGLRVCLGIFPSNLVRQMLRVYELNPLDYVKSVAGRMLDGVDPGFSIEANRIDYERVASYQPME